MVWQKKEEEGTWEYKDYEIKIVKQHFDGDSLPSFKGIIKHEDAPFGVWKSEWDYAHSYEMFFKQWRLPFVSKPSNSDRIKKLLRSLKDDIDIREGAME